MTIIFVLFVDANEQSSACCVSACMYTCMGCWQTLSLPWLAWCPTRGFMPWCCVCWFTHNCKNIQGYIIYSVLCMRSFSLVLMHLSLDSMKAVLLSDSFFLEFSRKHLWLKYPQTIINLNRRGEGNTSYFTKGMTYEEYVTWHRKRWESTKHWNARKLIFSEAC